MIQENTTLILFLLFICTSLCIYFFIDFKSQKSRNKLQFDVIYNQIAKEKILKEHYKKGSIKIDESQERLQQKLLHLKTNINTIDHSLQELYDLIL
jgi:uncharacterized membrane protein